MRLVRFGCYCAFATYSLDLVAIAALNRLWIGSANLTRRGVTGPNAEVMAQLDIPAGVADALAEYVEDSEPFDGAEADADPDAADRRAAERALDDALAIIVESELELRREADGLTLFSGTSFDAFLAGHLALAALRNAACRPDLLILDEFHRYADLVTPAVPPPADKRSALDVESNHSSRTVDS